MIFLFGPTKEQTSSAHSGTIYQYEDKAQFLKEKLAKISDLQATLKISNKKYVEYQQMLQNSQSPALYMYNGLSYRQLKRDDYGFAERVYLNKYVRILSAMYGILKPLDLVNNYRLDYQTSIGINLYDYWQEIILDNLSTEKTIISLASNEFTKKLPGVIKVVFMVDSERLNTTETKKMRGKFLNRCIIDKVATLNEFLKISIDDFEYDYSKDNLLVFTKKSLQTL